MNLLWCDGVELLGTDEIARLVEPYVGRAALPTELYSQLRLYLRLLLQWNERTNLTAIRDPKEIVRRHFGESLFAGLQLPENVGTMLDFGSGAGFPGLPIQLLYPELSVTLGESQGKKASFLREAVRELRLRTEIWPSRVEAMPIARRFDVVTMRAVDKMESAKKAAACRVRAGGVLLILSAGGAGVLLPDSRTGVVQLNNV